MPRQSLEDQHESETRSEAPDESSGEETDVPGMPDRPVPVYPSPTMPQPVPAGADQLDAIDDLDDPQR